MGRYSSDDSVDSGRAGIRNKKSTKHSSNRKGRSRSSSSESYRRHRRKCKGRRSRSRERYRSKRKHGGSSSKSSKRSYSSSSSSSDDSRRNSKRSPDASSTSMNKNSNINISNLTAEEQLKAKVQMAISAGKQAENAIRQRKLESNPEDTPILVPDVFILDEINSNSFIQKTFTSTARPVVLPGNIPLPADHIKSNLADVGVMSATLLENQEEKQKQWVKKLFFMRKKALAALEEQMDV